MIQCAGCDRDQPKVRGEKPQVPLYCAECVERGLVPPKPWKWGKK